MDAVQPSEESRAIRRRARRAWILFAVAGTGLLTCAAATLILSRRAVDGAIGALDSTASVGAIEAAWLSRHHGLVVRYEVVGDSQISRAYWCAWPGGTVILEK